MPKKPTPKSLDQFLKELAESNTTVADWAREQGFRLDSVYAVTRRRAAGTRGEAREILKRMGVALPPMFKQRNTERQAA